MKSFFALPVLLAVLPAFADLDQVATLLAQRRSASYEVTTRSTQDPIQIDAQVQSKSGQRVRASAEATPEAFVTAVRAKKPARKIQSGEYTLIQRWEKLSLVQGGQEMAVYDVLNDIKNNQWDPADQDPSNQNAGGISQKTALLSIVGPYVSYLSRGDAYFPGAAHPSSWENFLTVDLASLKGSAFEAANLLDLVDESSLVKALKKDRALRPLIPKHQLSSFLKASSVREIEDLLFGNLERCYSLPIYDGKMASFAVYDYDAKTNLVSIRVPMTAAARVCQAEATLLQMGLLVKPNAKFQKSLLAQAKKGDGILMKQKIRY